MKNSVNQKNPIQKGKSGLQNQTGKENIRFNDHKHRPEIRDDLDSREMEEQEFKGDDITHNRKPHHSKKQEKKK